jgi:hypothetical protein
LSNTADENTATGAGALLSNTVGTGNTANGAFALFSNTGSSNTATGDRALFSNTGAGGNTATGFQALASATTGGENTATGADALSSNTVGSGNTANGVQALFSNTIGMINTATGHFALFSNTGSSNTAIGAEALANNTTGAGNTALGVLAGTGVSTAQSVICIGATGANVDNSCYIGQIFGQPVDPATATAVAVDTNGKLGTTVSSRRFKHDIKPMDNASEAILALKPVTFRYKSDAKGTPQFGLIAEEVAQVSPDLAVRDKNGEILSVHYDQINAMLLNEFLKEHRKVEEQQATIAELKSTVAQQQNGFESKLAEQEKQIEALTSGLQKVSAQVEINKPAPQMASLPAVVRQLPDKDGNNP